LPEKRSSVRHVEVGPREAGQRVDNFLNFYQKDPGFIQALIDHFDPLDFRFTIFIADD